MLRKLRILERGCNAVVIFDGIFLLLTISGSNPSGLAVIVELILMIGMAIIASRLRKQINSIVMERHRKLPIQATRATVVKRRVGYRYSSGGSSGQIRCSAPLWYVTFQTDKQGKIELYVPRDVYYAVCKGLTGELRYKENEFISFI